MENDVTTLIEVPRKDLNTKNEPTTRMRWVIFGTICFIFFSLLKLPIGRVKPLIEGYLQSTLSKTGIQLDSNESDFSLLLGLRYKMKGVKVTIPAKAISIQIDEIVFRPKIISILTGKIGGTLVLEKAPSTIQLSFQFGQNDFNFSYEVANLDSTPWRIFPILFQIQGSARLEGSGYISGTQEDLTSLSGHIKMKAEDIRIDEQSLPWLFGMKTPKLFAKTGIVDAQIKKGAIDIKSLTIGKSGSQDDFIGGVTGSFALGKTFYQSRANASVQFSLSDNFMKISGLLPTLLKPYEKSPKNYQIKLSGPIMQIVQGTPQNKDLGVEDEE